MNLVGLYYKMAFEPKVEAGWFFNLLFCITCWQLPVISLEVWELTVSFCGSTSVELHPKRSICISLMHTCLASAF